MSYPTDQLEPPKAVHDDPRAVEIMRIWVAGRGEHVALRAEAWEDLEQWGRMLAGVARYISRAHTLAHGKDTAECVACIRRGFEEELDAPSDQPSADVSG